MTDLEIIKQAMQSASDERKTLAAKRVTKATGRQLEKLEIQEKNLEVFQEMLANGFKLSDLYVSTDTGAEVGKIFQVLDKEVEIEYFDGTTRKVAGLPTLLVDKKATVESVQADSQILSNGHKYKLLRLIYPGQVEAEGVDGLIENWSVVKAEPTPAKEPTSSNEVDEVYIPVFIPLAQQPADAPQLNLSSVEKRQKDNYYFTIGKIDDEQYAGELYKEEGEKKTLLVQTRPHKRYHWVRSVLVKKYHQSTKVLVAGITAEFDPWLLAFADENQEAYHADDSEEDISDILEDLDSGKPILQRVGVSVEGEIFSGYRRTLAAIERKLDTIPIEAREFKDRIDFIEALFSANKTRKKTVEIEARERRIYYRYCSEQARKARNSKLLSFKQEHPDEQVQSFGVAWERAAEEAGISGATAAAQDRIIEWLDTSKDKKLVGVVRQVLNKGTRTTATCRQIINLAQEQGADVAYKVGKMIADGGATSVPKALTKLKYGTPSPNTLPKGVHIPPSGTIPPQRELTTPKETQAANTVDLTVPALPDWLMRAVMSVLNTIDIDVFAGSDAAIPASHHLTRASEKLDGLKVDWQLPKQDKPVKIFGNFCSTQSVDNWMRSLEREWGRGHIESGIVCLSNPSLAAKTILRNVASASADILTPVALLTNNKPGNTKISVTIFYLGDDWQRFAEVFDDVSDVRIKQWALQEKRQVVAWETTSEGAIADYKGLKLSVKKAPDMTWYGEIDGTKVIDGIENEGLTKTLTAASASEQALLAVVS
ncbi:MAG: hypothetical protein ACREPR_24155 [Brasilonema sp.]